MTSYQFVLNIIIILGGIAFLIFARSVKLGKRRITIKANLIDNTNYVISKGAVTSAADKIKDILTTEGIAVTNTDGIRLASNKLGFIYSENAWLLPSLLSKYNQRKLRLFQKNKDILFRLIHLKEPVSGVLLAYLLENRIEVIS